MEFENYYQINPKVSATTTPTLIPKFHRVKTDQFERTQDYVFDIVKSSQHYIVSLSNFQIQIFDQVEFKLQQKLNFHQDTINFVKPFDNFGFASGSSDGTVAIWDIRTGNQPSIIIKGNIYYNI
jgi:WD40 repeat protein